MSGGGYSTPAERPYGYSIHIISGPIKKYTGDDLVSDYDDRLRQFYPDRWADACKLLGGNRFKGAPLSKLSKFLSYLYQKEVKCLQVFEGCNVGNGYPYFVFLSRKLSAQGTPTRSAETTGSVGEADGGPVPQGCAQGSDA
jgi:hypothetical protein